MKTNNIVDRFSWSIEDVHTSTFTTNDNVDGLAVLMIARPIDNDASFSFRFDDFEKDILCRMNGCYSNSFVIKKVIFNDPATIVLWSDGSKTVVKCQDGDTFDPEKGLAMAFVKKIFGNKGSYCNQIKKWTDKYYEEQAEDCSSYAFPVLGSISEKIVEAQKRFYEALVGRGSDIDGESKK